MITLEEQEIGRIHDIIFDALDIDAPNEDVIKYWNSLPENLKLNIKKYGINDTPSRDKIFVYFEEYRADKQKLELFQPHFYQYWEYVKCIIDKNGWVYNKDLPFILDTYFEHNTGVSIEFQKMYEYTGEWRGYRWRPKIVSELMKINQ